MQDPLTNDLPTWQPMTSAPTDIARVWLKHPTLGTIPAEGRKGRWYSPDARRQVWRWYRPSGDALEIFAGWLPIEALPEPATNDSGSNQAQD